MSDIDREWAISELSSFIAATKIIRHPYPSTGVFVTINVGSREEISSQAYVVDRILDVVFPSWKQDFPNPRADKWRGYHEVALRAKTALERQTEIEEKLGDNSPHITVSQLHPWIWEEARSLWNSGHFREAVSAAVRKINAETQNKIGRRDISETNLFKQAFSLDPAREGKARLRRMTPDSSKTYQSVQRGAWLFAEGIFAGIRNPLSHEAENELSEHEALEYLAALSVLARWVDQSTVEKARGES
jgi:putative uncharacterized protein hsdX